MSEVEPTGQHRYVATRSGQNVLEAEKLVVICWLSFAMVVGIA